MGGVAFAVTGVCEETVGAAFGWRGGGRGGEASCSPMTAGARLLGHAPTPLSLKKQVAQDHH